MGSLFGGKQKSSSTQSGTSTQTHYQQDYYDKLLQGAGDWLDQGGSGQTPSYIKDMEGALLGQLGQYQDVLSGKVDRSALQASLSGQREAMQQGLSRGAMRDIGLSSVGAGTSNSSRRGIAEGIAIGDANAALAQQQANTINQFEQQQIANQMNAAQGMNSVIGNLANIQGMAQGMTPEAQRMKDLLAFQQLISGNMGGTSTQEGTSTGTQSSGGNLFGQALGAASTIGGLMGLSDEGLKKNIKKKKKKGKPEKTKDGIDKASWEWNKKAEKKYGLKGKAEGVIAQEAMKKRPDAVKKNLKGDLMVDYGKI